MMMKVECLTSYCPLLILLIVCKTIVVAKTSTGSMIELPSTTTSQSSSSLSSLKLLPKDDNHNNQKSNDGRSEMNKIVKYVRAAKYLQSPNGENSMMLIQSRPVRARLGSEFLGKRSEMPIHEGKSRIQKRRAMGSEFLGKRRAMGSEFLGKRNYQIPQIDEYYTISSETGGNGGTGTDWTKPNESQIYIEQGIEPLSYQKKNNNNMRRASDYIGKRKIHDYPTWKQPTLNSRLIQFDKKRRVMGSEFLGKRSSFQTGKDELNEFGSEKGNF